MKLAVSYDTAGNITTLFDPAKMKSEKGTLTYVPAPGEKHQHLDLPKEFEGKAVTELPALLRVREHGSHASLERKS
jgi:hypothetical protein